MHQFFSLSMKKQLLVLSLAVAFASAVNLAFHRHLALLNVFMGLSLFAAWYFVRRCIASRKGAEQKIEALNADLVRQAVELESANRELAAFGYTVSHDLRATLTNISLRCQIMMETDAAAADGELKNHICGILLATKRIDRFVTSLLDLSRSSSGALDCRTVDLSEKALAIAEELRFGQPERDVRFVISRDVTARGDAGLLEVVMWNLLGNAWKYTGTTEHPVIEFGMTEEAGQRSYFVRDNGVGFEMSQADGLYEAFQRLHGDEEFEGHGIGLATVQRIVRRHGGRIWAQSETGKGSTFYFTL